MANAESFTCSSPVGGMLFGVSGLLLFNYTAKKAATT